jgi:SAM-dependent methyltransferase
MAETPPVKRLTEASDWDLRYEAKATPNGPARGRLPERFFGSYLTRRFWALIGANLPPQRGQSVLEIGCAPGRVLKDFVLRFGCVPFGMDFSKPGVDRTHENFEQWGYPLENVTHADVFDSAFQTSVSGKYDIVVSGGFIEHFTDMRSVVNAHLAPLRPGGILIITIPNYRGLNYAMGCLTVRESYPLHNFEIMSLKRFRSLFALPELQTLFCGYIGGFDISIFDTGVQTLFLKALRRAQTALNFGFRMVPPPELPWTSPCLMFVGKKVSG